MPVTLPPDTHPVPAGSPAASTIGKRGVPLLEVKNLQVYFPVDEGIVKAVDDVSFTIHEGETLGVVGESGSGKSVTALTIMRILASNGRIMGGQVLYKGQDLLTLPEREMQKIRGNEISMIFQDPMTCLNPVLTVGDQLAEAIILHQKVTKRVAWDRATEMLQKVKIPLPEERMKQFPFELSGGMRQRVMIAMALSCEPSLLIADEPTTALDVTIQAQILELIAELQKSENMAVQMITHDLGVVAEICDRVVVMYAGRVAETGVATEIFKAPKHPYTEGLLACLPRLDLKRDRLHPIEGQPPNLARLPAGCSYVMRCPKRFPECIDVRPPLYQVSPTQASACLLLDEQYRLKALDWYRQTGQTLKVQALEQGLLPPVAEEEPLGPPSVNGAAPNATAANPEVVGQPGAGTLEVNEPHGPPIPGPEAEPPNKEEEDLSS